MAGQPRQRSSSLINGACYLTLGLLGVYLSVYQSVVGDISADFRLSAGLTGLMVSFHFLGSFLLPILLGELGDHIGTRPIVLFAFLMLISGLSLVVLSRAPLLFLVATLLIGGGFAVVEGLLTGLLAVANPRRVNSVMNISQMFFCLGAVAGPFVAWGLKAAGMDWRSNYVLLLVLFIICLIWIGRQQLPPYQTAPIKGLYLKQLLQDRIFIVLLISIFLYVGIEEGAAFWVTGYIDATVRTAIPGGFFLASYWLGMAVGRWLFSYLRKNFNTWLVAGLAFSGLFICLLLVMNQAGWSLLWLFLAGFGFAPAWPVLMMNATIRGKNATNTAMGSMMALGAAGGMAAPFALGQLVDRTGMERAMVLLIVLLVALVGLLLVSQIHKRMSAEL
jgi:fucose permease